MSSPRRPPRARPAVTATRGPLPPGVYWRRRAFVLGVAFSLVFVIAQWLGAGSDGSDDAADPAVAEQAAGEPATPTGTVTADAEGAGGEGAGAGAPTGDARASASPTLAAPEGVCEAADVAVTPSVAEPAVAGETVVVQLSLQTLTSEACTWEVSGSRVIVKIADGSDVLWTTGECGRAVERRSVVVRRAVATLVEVSWNGRKSDAGCTRRTNWVLPGDYTVAAAAYGGEPASAGFSLQAPAAVTTTPGDTYQWVPAR